MKNQTKIKVIWHKAESMWQTHPSLRLYLPGDSIKLAYGATVIPPNNINNIKFAYRTEWTKL